jgi:TonB family protein
MFSSPLNRNSRRGSPDHADRVSSAVGLAMLLTGLLWLGGRPSFGPRPGEVRIFPETVLRLALAPVPIVPAAPPLVPNPPPALEPETEPATEPVEVPPPDPKPQSEPMPEPAAQPPVEIEGEAGRTEAIRAEWLARLRRRIEENKFYPGAARYVQETGTVFLRVQISPSAEITDVEVLENTGSVLLVEGARAILRRAASTPLDPTPLPGGMQVQVPITYRISR